MKKATCYNCGKELKKSTASSLSFVFCSGKCYKEYIENLYVEQEAESEIIKEDIAD